MIFSACGSQQSVVHAAAKLPMYSTQILMSTQGPIVRCRGSYSQAVVTGIATAKACSAQEFVAGSRFIQFRNIEQLGRGQRQILFPGGITEAHMQTIV